MKFVFFMLLFFCFSVHAKDFISFCKKQGPGWQGYVIPSRNCEELREKLSKISSLSEFYRPNKMLASKRKSLSSPWTDDFPFLYGLERRTAPGFSVYNPQDSHFGDDYDVRSLSEFQNIVDFSYLPEFGYYSGKLGICRMLQVFPHIKTITIESDLLKNSAVDNCLSKSKIEGVIIRDKFQGYDKEFLPKTKIIGIEYFSGNLSRLKNFKDLRYLGISNNTNVLEGIESLYLLSRVSHLSLNANSRVSDLEKIKLFRNLEYLNISCAESEEVHSPFAQKCKEFSFITNISFVSPLRFLKHLNLSFNSIEDISPVLNLRDLTFLKLRENKIKNVPDLSVLEKLVYLDLSGNLIKDLSTIGKSSSLKFLNISGNEIKNLYFVLDLRDLEFLNASQNPLEELLPDNAVSYSVTVLNLNGSELGKKSKIDYLQVHPGAYRNQVFMYEALFHDVQNTVTNINLRHNDFSCFNNLEVLSYRNNDLISFPASQYLRRLQYIDVEGNRIDQLPDLSGSRNLYFLNIRNNEFTSVDVERLPPNYSFRESVLNDVKSTQKY